MLIKSNRKVGMGGKRNNVLGTALKKSNMNGFYFTCLFFTLIPHMQTHIQHHRFQQILGSNCEEAKKKNQSILVLQREKIGHRHQQAIGIFLPLLSGSKTTTLLDL